MFRITLFKNKSFFSYSFELSDKFREYVNGIKGKQFNNSRLEIPITEFHNFKNYLTEQQIEIEEQKPAVTFTQENNICNVKFDYNKEIIEIVKQIKGKRYIAAKKIWTIPIEEKEELINKLESFDVIIASEV